MAVRQVLYVSSGVKYFSDAEIEDILDNARRRNAETGVTGVLFYLEGNFLQLLEGEDPALEETYLRIKSDPRHRGLTKLLDTEIEQRSFPEWQMGFRAITVTEMRDNPDLFHLVDGRWMVPQEAGVDEQIKIIFETFLTVNDSRDYRPPSEIRSTG